MWLNSGSWQAQLGLFLAHITLPTALGRSLERSDEKKIFIQPRDLLYRTRAVRTPETLHRRGDGQRRALAFRHRWRTPAGQSMTITNHHRVPSAGAKARQTAPSALGFRGGLVEAIVPICRDIHIARREKECAA